VGGTKDAAYGFAQVSNEERERVRAGCVCACVCSVCLSLYVGLEGGMEGGRGDSSRLE
jgi:streptolysin S family bacteriocin protoxin